MNGLEELMQLAREQGLFKRSPIHVLLCLMGNGILAVMAVWAFGASTAWWARGSAAIVLAAATVGFGAHSHTSLHFGTSGRRWVNVLLGRVGLPLLVGISATAWLVTHNQRHHSAPNVSGIDGDSDLAPWFILTEDAYAASRGAARLWYRWQWLFFPVALLFNHAHTFLRSWGFVLSAWRDPSTSAAWLASDIFWMSVHLALWIALPAQWMGWAPALALYLARSAALGFVMFAVFGPGHLPAEAAAFAKAPPKDAFAQHQIAASVDFSTGWLGRMICGGLEFQIEHHLFPAAPPARFPELRHLVQAHCAAKGIPYHLWSWDRALWKAFDALRTRKPLVQFAPSTRVFPNSRPAHSGGGLP